MIEGFDPVQGHQNKYKNSSEVWQAMICLHKYVPIIECSMQILNIY